MRMFDIINDKKNKKELTDEEIAFFVKGYTYGDIPNYQASALLMAICMGGFSEKETITLTREMANSGDILDLSAINGITADKHSTGGVGDKTTLIVAPICASLGLKIAKMSGKGIGHTGGTVDKLESIDGYNTKLTNDEFFKQVNDIGIALIGQTGNLTPCDKKLYALRDVTATVNNYSLISSSIMSKKIAAGAKNIVLDVKCGSGAFMKTPDEAKLLAKMMAKIGKVFDRNLTAVITNMDSPLGKNIGNSLEVIESIDVLKGNGDKRLTELCLCLSANMLEISFKKPYDECYKMAENSIKDGSALKKLVQLVKAQGGNENLILNPSLFKKGEISYEVKSEKSGFISKMNTEKIGECAVILGVGREKLTDEIDFSAGIILKAKTGDYIKKGETLCTFYTAKSEKIIFAEGLFKNSIVMSDEPPQSQPVIYEIIK
ncbi:MAG: thymidine phosphorylase [Oscillospiraceae bacterium]